MLDGGRPRGQGKGLRGADGGNQGVSGEGGEVIEKGTEAVDWEAVLGSASGLLGNGRPTGRTIRLLVAKYPGRSPEKRLDPVVYLAGGPGQATPADFIRADLSAYNSTR